MSKTIDEILTDLIKMADSQDYQIPHMVEHAKQAIREAILTEVIPDILIRPHLTESQRTLLEAQRQRLDAWLGLEDTSSND